MFVTTLYDKYLNRFVSSVGFVLSDWTSEDPLGKDKLLFDQILFG